MLSFNFFVGDCFVGDCFVGDCFVGDCFVGDCFVGDCFVGDCTEFVFDKILLIDSIFNINFSSVFITDFFFDILSISIADDVEMELTSESYFVI